MLRICTALIVSILLPAAIAAPTVLAAEGKPLKPMAKPAIKLGTTKVWRDNRSQWMVMTMSADERTVSYATTGGCRFTQGHEEFSPWLKWEGCFFGTGEGTAKLIEGKIWPLQTGTRFVWRFTGNNQKGQSWDDKMECTVKGTARIAVPAGEFDTYQVVCEDRWNERTWYVAPKLGTTVKFSRARHDGSRSYAREMVSFVSAE